MYNRKETDARFIGDEFRAQNKPFKHFIIYTCATFRSKVFVAGLISVLLYYITPNIGLMKLLFYFLTFAVLSAANAQDYCKQIKKDVSPDKKLIDLTSPSDESEVTTLRVSRNINLDPDYEADNFVLILQVEGDLDNIYTKTTEGEQIEKDEKKVIIEFEDKSTVVDDTIKVSHDFTNDRMQSIRFVYLPLTDANLKDLTTKKITKITLAGYDKAIQPENAKAIMNYIKCIKAAK